MKKIFLPIIMLLSVLFMSNTVHADELSANFQLSNGGDASAFTDGSHYSVVGFNAGDTITISSTDNNPITGIYITWDSVAVPWTLTTDNGDISCGNNGFLHEFVSIENGSATLTINIPADSMRISNIRIFSAGVLPHDVQVWNPPCEKADIMVVSSHADDEILFFGGVLPTYAYTYDADIQVIYMTQFWNGQKIREHEKLDGLWECGIRYYPVCGNFNDLYSEDIETAASQYDYNAMVSYLVSEIRKFTPQVVVTHDINGEYGHGYHMLTTKAVTEAIESANNSALFPESATTYGVWDTPKYYIHIYKENAIKLDLRTPIEEDYLKRTALDICIAAYEKHVSQQWCWYYISDDYQFSCADYGLYRSLVGDDTTNDLLCNLKTYKVQAAEEAARLQAEEESREQASKEAESKRLEQESIEQASIEEASRQQASMEKASKEAESQKQADLEKDLQRIRITTFSIIAVAVLAIIVGIVFFTIKQKKNNKSGKTLS